MSDLAMAQYLGNTMVGGTVWVRAENLQLPPAAFHSAVIAWEAQGGGPGFRIVGTPHMPKDGSGYYDMMQVKRIG